MMRCSALCESVPRVRFIRCAHVRNRSLGLLAIGAASPMGGQFRLERLRKDRVIASQPAIRWRSGRAANDQGRALSTLGHASIFACMDSKTESRINALAFRISIPMNSPSSFSSGVILGLNSILSLSGPSVIARCNISSCSKYAIFILFKSIFCFGVESTDALTHKSLQVWPIHKDLFCSEPKLACIQV